MNSRLMPEGKIRLATRFLTERTEGGGVMNPNESAGKPQGKSVMEVLLSKQNIQTNKFQMKKLLLNARNSQFF